MLALALAVSRKGAPGLALALASDNFVNKGWQGQGSANATAGKEQVGAQTGFVNGLATYQIGSTGLMANVDLSGSKYFKDKDLN